MCLSGQPALKVRLAASSKRDASHEKGLIFLSLGLVVAHVRLEY